MLPLVAPPLPGKVDLWQLDPGIVGGEVFTKKSKTLLYYICSPSTAYITSEDNDKSGGSALLKVIGPIADDGARIYVRFRLSRVHLALWSEEERELLAKKLAQHMTSTFAVAKALNTKWILPRKKK